MLGVYQLSEKSATQSLTTKLASFESAYREKKKEGTARDTRASKSRRGPAVVVPGNCLETQRPPAGE